MLFKTCDFYPMSSWRKFITYAKLPEMRVFWLFLPLLIIFTYINIVYLPRFWTLITSFSFFVIGLVVLVSNLRLAKSNLEITIEKNELRSIIANLQDGVVAYDPSFNMLIFNRTAEVIFKVRSEEVLHQQFTPESAHDRRFGLLTRVIFPSLAPVVIQRRDPGIFPQITDLSFDDPAIEFRVVTDRILDSSGNLLGFVKLVHDRTREVEFAKSKNEFISVAAHQLRTPLSGVHWAFETLAKEVLTKEQKEVVDGGLAAAINLLKIVNDLLDVSKIEEGRYGYKFENINIIDFVKGVIGDIQNVHRGSSVKIYLRKPSEANIQVLIDPDRLKIAMMNLLDNAVKYNVENGQVVVGVERLKGTPYIEISIKDTGVGVSEDEIKKLFTKFFRSEAVKKIVTEGTGLGLYIVKNIIRNHGGEIRAESELGRGTTFYFTLPIDPKLIPPKEMAYGEE